MTTVSAYIAGRKHACSEETAARIRTAIDDLHYVPAAPLRGIRQRETQAIGLMITKPLEASSDPWFTYAARLWAGIMREADERDYGLFAFSRSLINNLDDYTSLLDGRVDGLIFTPDLDDDRPMKTAEAGMPTVVTDRYARIHSGCGAACSDEGAVVDIALEHLWALGHRRIAHVAGPFERVAGPTPQECSGATEIALARMEIFGQWLSQRGAHDPMLVTPANSWSIPQDKASRILDRWLSLPAPPTAVLCASDMIARSISRAAAERGVSVPAQLSIVGIDDSPAALMSNPRLTTVRLSTEKVGAEAMKALIRIMDGADPESCRSWIPPIGLTIRGSTAPP